jgi:hypothetical protein
MDAASPCLTDDRSARQTTRKGLLVIFTDANTPFADQARMIGRGDAHAESTRLRMRADGVDVTPICLKR